MGDAEAPTVGPHTLWVWPGDAIDSVNEEARKPWGDHDRANWLALLMRESAQAVVGGGDAPEYRERLVRVAAVAVLAIDQFDKEQETSQPPFEAFGVTEG